MTKRKKRKKRPRSHIEQARELYGPAFEKAREEGQLVHTPKQKDRDAYKISRTLMAAEIEDSGLRPTMASRLGQMLRMAKVQFGERDHSFTFLGFEVVEGRSRLYHLANNCMIMQLSESLLLNPTYMYHTMAHECVHMISPNQTMVVNMLEEGIATMFSIMYMRDIIGERILPVSLPIYEEAALLVAGLFNADPFGIKKIREEEPVISLITEELLLKYYPGLPPRAAARLAERYPTEREIFG